MFWDKSGDVTNNIGLKILYVVSVSERIGTGGARGPSKLRLASSRHTKHILEKESAELFGTEELADNKALSEIILFVWCSIRQWLVEFL